MKLSETFDTVAELYDRARPRYQAELYDDLARITGLREGAKALEIAPATGIATIELAGRGYEVTAVEMGANLAAVARRNLAGYSNASVEVSRFEDWPLPDGPFDLICCATAFAWLDPSVRLDKCAQALRPGGWLAIWGHDHVAGGTGQFFIDSQDCYERWMPGTEPGIRLVASEDIPVPTYGVEAHPEFELPLTRKYLEIIPYSTRTYLDVIATYSGHIALSRENYEGLFACIRRLIDAKYGGAIEKAYATNLMLAKRRA